MLSNYNIFERIKNTYETNIIMIDLCVVKNTYVYSKFYARQVLNKKLDLNLTTYTYIITLIQYTVNFILFIFVIRIV